MNTYPILPNRRDVMTMAGAAALCALIPVKSSAASKLRFITPFNFSLSYAPVFYAAASGMYGAEGLEVEVINGKGAPLALQLIVAGQGELAHTGAVNYILAKVNSDAPLISIATYSQRSPFFIISSPKDPINVPADMKGKTIGVASLGGSQFGTLNNVLIGAGIDPESVNKVVTNDGPASYGLIEAGRIAGYVGPIHTNVLLPQAIKMTLDDGLPSQVYIVRPQDLAEDEDKFASFLKVTRESIFKMLDAEDLSPFLTAIKNSYELVDLEDMALAQTDLKLYLEGIASQGRENVLRNVHALFEAAAKILSDSKQVNGPVDPASLYTNSLFDKFG